VFGYAGLLAFVLWFLAVRPRLPLRERISGLLQLLAVYTFIVGLLSASGAFASLASLQRELASPDPLVFLRANLVAFAGLFAALAVALDPGALSAQTFIAVPVVILLELLLFVYAVVHFFVIVPLAYFAYFLASVPVDAILNAPSDVEIQFGKDSVAIKTLVQKNEVALRNFAVGIPAFMVSLFLKLWPLVRRAQPSN
jgi:hypothetical protein